MKEKVIKHKISRELANVIEESYRKGFLDALIISEIWDGLDLNIPYEDVLREGIEKTREKWILE